MTADSAVSLARDLLAEGFRIIQMESIAGETLNEDEVKELCKSLRRL